MSRTILAAAIIAGAPLQAAAQALAGAAPMTRNNAYAQSFPASDGSTRVNLSASGDTMQVLSLPRGKSAVVDLPVDARDVLVTNPAVADAVLRGPRRIMVMGVAPGQTDAVFFDGAGRRILSLDIRVDVDAGALNDTIARLIPGSRVRVEALNNSVVLTGQVANAAAADQAVRLAQSYVATPQQVVNMLSIAGKEQVMLKVRIIEVQRNTVKQLGFDLSALTGQLGEPQFLFNKAASFAINGGLLGGLSAGYKVDTQQQPVIARDVPITTQVPQILTDTNPVTGATTQRIVMVDQTTYKSYDFIDRNDALATNRASAGDPGLNQANSAIQALERVGLLRTLAEPNLTAISGESAKFLAGGEYPVPTGQSENGEITIEFKPYGVGLGFTPVVLSEGRISLRISTEVSELTSEGAFTLNRAGGITIPALSVRRAETTVELPSGGSMMIAGLLQDKTRQNLDSLPGVMNLPILGTLFRSRDYLKGETELVILVTPYLVKPTGPGQLQTPADGLRIAHDMETVLLGKLNKSYGTKAAAVQQGGRTYQGPYGYVIE